MKWMLALLLTLQGALSSAAPSCRAVVAKTSAPETFVVDVENGDAEEFIETALVELLEEGQLVETKALLRQIAREGTDFLTLEQILTLKNTRKRATILRSAIAIGTNEHEVSEGFVAFVRELGNLNDLIAAKRGDQTPACAKKTLRFFKKIKFEKLDHGLKAGKAKVVRKYFAKGLARIRKILAQGLITIRDYHDVRKILKDFLTYYHLSDDSQESSQFQEETAYLFELNEELGVVNDRFTFKIIAGQASEKDFVRFPPTLKRKVEYFIDHCTLTE